MSKEMEVPFNNYYLLLGKPMNTSRDDLEKAVEQALIKEREKITKEQEKMQKSALSHLSLFSNPTRVKHEELITRQKIQNLLIAKEVFSTEEKKQAADQSLLASIQQMCQEAKKPEVDYYHLLGLKNDVLEEKVRDEFMARLGALTLTKMFVPPDKQEHKMLEELTATIYKKIWPTLMNHEQKQEYDKSLNMQFKPK